MNIYLLKQDINNGYDTYDSAIVSAENEDEARKIHPSFTINAFNRVAWKYSESLGWVSFDDVDKIEVDLVGVSNVDKGLVLASYNAG